MPRQVIKIEGLRELEHALSELPKATGKNVLKRALFKAGEPIRSDAAARAPRLTGALQMSMAVGTKLTRRQKQMHRQESTIEVFVGAGGLAQAVQQEFGNAHHAAQPFLRPAWDSHKMAALESIKSDLALEIEKARARLARKAARLAAKLRGER